MIVGQKVEIVGSNHSGVYPGDTGEISNILNDDLGKLIGYGVKVQCRTVNAFGGGDVRKEAIVFFVNEQIKSI